MFHFDHLKICHFYFCFEMAFHFQIWPDKKEEKNTAKWPNQYKNWGEFLVHQNVLVNLKLLFFYSTKKIFCNWFSSNQINFFPWFFQFDPQSGESTICSARAMSIVTVYIDPVCQSSLLNFLMTWMCRSSGRVELFGVNTHILLLTLLKNKVPN